MTASNETYVGTQLFPGLVLALFDCLVCHSTRAAVLFDAGDESEPELAVAAE